MPPAIFAPLGLMALASGLLLALLGQFSPAMTPDTAGYFDLGTFPGNLTSARTPVYGWVIGILTLGSSKYTFVPAIHFVIFLGSVWLLCRSLRKLGLSQTAVLSVAAGALFSNAILMLMNTVHPEFLAIACALYSVSGTIELATDDQVDKGWPLLAIFAGSGIAYLTRPSFLPLVLLLPILYALAAAARRTPVRLTTAVAIWICALVPFLSMTVVRGVAVGDWNIVSFGGFQMSGMATLMLDEDVVDKLPSAVRTDALALLKARTAAESSGEIIGVPKNSSGARSFTSAALGYFDVLARTHDEVLYRLNVNTKRPDETWIAFNNRMMRYSIAVVGAAPLKYVAWVMGAATRVVGRVVTQNVPMVIAVAGLLVVWPVTILSGRSWAPQTATLDSQVLVLLALFWLACTQGLTVLVTFPANRYIDTSALLISPIAIYVVASMVIALRTDEGHRSTPPEGD